MCVCVCVCKKEWNESDKIYEEEKKRIRTKNIYCSFYDLSIVCLFICFVYFYANAFRNFWKQKHSLKTISRVRNKIIITEKNLHISWKSSSEQKNLSYENVSFFRHTHAHTHIHIYIYIYIYIYMKRKSTTKNLKLLLELFHFLCKISLFRTFPNIMCTLFEGREIQRNLHRYLIDMKKPIYIYIGYYLPTPPLGQAYDTRSIFKRSLTGLNQSFPSPRLVASPRLKNLVRPTIYP